jgi:hypothetical protein
MRGRTTLTLFAAAVVLALTVAPVTAAEPWIIWDPGPPIITEFNEIRSAGFPTCTGSQKPRAQLEVWYADEDGVPDPFNPVYAGARMWAEFATTTGTITKEKFSSNTFRDAGAGSATTWHVLSKANGTMVFRVVGPVGSQFNKTQGWLRVLTLGGPTGVYDFWFMWADVAVKCV